MPDHEDIAQKAYELWEQNGRPEGQDQDFWRAAAEALAQDDAPANADGAPVEQLASAPPTNMVGHVDLAKPTQIGGWVFNPQTPEQPLTVVVLDHGVEIARMIAQNYRRDLEDAGLGSGYCGFDIFFPENALAPGPHDVELRILETGSPMPDVDAKIAHLNKAF